MMGPMGMHAMAAAFGISPLVFTLIFLALAVWSLVLKGLALWASAREGQRVWFVVMLIVNTFGILELAYLLFFRKKKAAAEDAQEA